MSTPTAPATNVALNASGILKAMASEREEDDGLVASRLGRLLLL